MGNYRKGSGLLERRWESVWKWREGSVERSIGGGMARFGLSGEGSVTGRGVWGS